MKQITDTRYIFILCITYGEKAQARKLRRSTIVKNGFTLPEKEPSSYLTRRKHCGLCNKKWFLMRP